MLFLSVSASNFIIGEATLIQDNFLRQEITDLILKNADFSATLEKMPLETAISKLRKNEITCFTANDISQIPSEEFDFVKYNSIYLGVIVNKKNSLKQISFEDLKKIFCNQEKNWSFLIPDNPYSIHRFGMPENSAVYLIANRIFPKNASGNNLLYYPIEKVEIMVESNANAIGLIELKKNNNYLRNVKLLPIVDKNDNATQLDFYLIFRKGEKAKIEELLSNG